TYCLGNCHAFRAEILTVGKLYNKKQKIVLVKYSDTDSGEYYKQCRIISYHHDKEFKMITQIYSTTGYKGCSIDDVCFGCKNVSLKNKLSTDGFKGDIP